MKKRIMTLMLLLPLLGSNVSAKEITPDQENELVRIRTTAYTCEEGRTTATGHPVRYGVVGVNSKYLCSYNGTEWCTAIYSEDGTEFYGYFDNYDCGLDAKNQTLIDVYFPTLEECQEWMEKTGGYVLVKFIRAEG